MMRKKLTYVLFISCWLLLTNLSAQDQKAFIGNEVRKDNVYGLRLGADLQNIVQSVVKPTYKGMEFMADFRITPKKYLALEVGKVSNKTELETITTTSEGSYFKLGVDQNTYKNLIGMRNMIYVGLRYGYSNFSQELNNFSIVSNDNFFAVDERISNLKDGNLSAHWAEFLVGIKVELYNNIYLGMSVAIQRKFYDEAPDGFDNLYIPGFGITNDLGDVGASFRYFLQYQIPFYKKDPPQKSEKIEEDILIENIEQ